MEATFLSHGQTRRHQRVSRTFKRERLSERQDSDAAPGDTTTNSDSTILSPMPSSTTNSPSESSTSEQDTSYSPSMTSTISATATSTPVESTFSTESSESSRSLLSDLISFLSSMEETVEMFSATSTTIATEEPTSIFTPTSTRLPSTQALPTTTTQTSDFQIHEVSSQLQTSTPTFVSSSSLNTPHFILVSHTSRPSSPPVASSTPTPHLLPATPDENETDHSTSSKTIILSSFLGFAIFLLLTYIVSRYRRGRLWRKEKAAVGIEWDSATKHCSRNSSKEELIADTRETTTPTMDGEKGLGSRFSAATSASSYSTASTNLSSTNSDYWIDPRYTGPDSRNAPMAPPALNVIEASSNTLQVNVTCDAAEPRPPRPPTPHAIALLTPQEFFSLPSSSSINADYACGKHERTGSAPVFGSVALGGGEGDLKERREAGMSRASQAMGRVLAQDGISGLDLRASGYSTEARGRRSNSVSVLMDMYLTRDSVAQQGWL